MPPSPVSEFARIIQAYNICNKSRLAVALSGGPDSTVIGHLVAAWHQMHMRPTDQPHATPTAPYAIVIDHAIRPESAQEADKVASWAQQAGLVPIVHRLTWASPLPSSNKIMDQARTLRYNALGNICTTKRITHLFLGHHLGMRHMLLLLCCVC